MNWTTFETNIKDAFLERAGVGIDPAEMPEPISPDVDLLVIAGKIANEYHKVAKASVQGTSTKRTILPTRNAALLAASLGIQAAIFGALKVSQESGVKPNMALMMPIGAAVVAYWSVLLGPLSISPYPVPPAFTALQSPTPGPIVLFPGLPLPVAKGFKNAFSGKDNINTMEEAVEEIARDIRQGFENHMKTVSGIYVGLIPGPAFPIPLVEPWKGMKAIG